MRGRVAHWGEARAVSVRLAPLDADTQRVCARVAHWRFRWAVLVSVGAAALKLWEAAHGPLRVLAVNVAQGALASALALARGAGGRVAALGRGGAVAIVATAAHTVPARRAVKHGAVKVSKALLAARSLGTLRGHAVRRGAVAVLVAVGATTLARVHVAGRAGRVTAVRVVEALVHALALLAEGYVAVGQVRGAVKVAVGAAALSRVHVANRLGSVGAVLVLGALVRAGALGAKPAVAVGL